MSVPANANDPYALNYAEFVVPLVRAVQQLDSINKSLQDQIDQLQSQGSGSNFQDSHKNNNSNENIEAIDVTLSSKTIVLNQNQPNPFKEQTTIHYFIPDNANNVKIIFTDSRGNILKEVSVVEKGNGQLNIYAQDLSSGIYTYTIVVDGETIDTKKMVCTK